MERRYLFVGYLVQEAFLVDPLLPGRRIATMDRPVPPELDQIRYEEIGGLVNTSRFLPEPPDMTGFPGYILSGYAIDEDAVVPVLGLNRSTHPSSYEYARHLVRLHDGLVLLGYDVIDEPANPFSLLHSSRLFTMDEVQLHAGPLNQYGLFASDDAARRFCSFAARENQEEGTCWQVWGSP